MIFVVGEKEATQNKVTIRYRTDKTQEFQSLDKAIAYIKNHTEKMPTFSLVFPELVSQQPIFTRVV